MAQKRTNGGQSEGKVRATNKNEKNDKNIYLFLYKEYSQKISGKNFFETLKLISELKNRKEYQELSLELQDDLYNKLMAM